MSKGDVVPLDVGWSCPLCHVPLVPLGLSLDHLVRFLCPVCRLGFIMFSRDSKMYVSRDLMFWVLAFHVWVILPGALGLGVGWPLAWRQVVLLLRRGAEPINKNLCGFCALCAAWASSCLAWCLKRHVLMDLMFWVRGFHVWVILPGVLGLGVGWPLAWRQVVSLLRWGAEPGTFCAAFVPFVPLGLHHV